MSAVSFQFEQFSMLELSELSAADLANYFFRNKSHLAESMPRRDEDFYTEAFWGSQVSRYLSARALGGEYRWFLVDSHRIIGHVSFDQIIKGPFQSCYVGYGIDFEFQGRGLMRQALKRSLTYMFEELGLNRIMANYEPCNVRSAKLLKKLGFEREGYARRYLKLNGHWRDHILASLIAGD